MLNRKYNCIDALQAAGINYEDACALRRISMTLHRWHELECGDSNAHNSFSMVRGKKVRVTKPAASTPCTVFEYDDNGKPYLEVHHNSGGTSYTLRPDRERGALKRMAGIMARYPGFTSYVQGDPRGASLYILPPAVCDSRDDPAAMPGWLEANYSRGIAVHQ